MSFGEQITKFRIKEKLTLRKVSLKLKAINSSVDLDDYSKIERGIQNPRNKKEFQDIIKVLNISDPQVIERLENKAMKFIPPKKIKDEDLLKYYPVFPKKNINHKELKKIIKESNTPNPPKNKE